MWRVVSGVDRWVAVTLEVGVVVRVEERRGFCSVEGKRGDTREKGGERVK